MSIPPKVAIAVALVAVIGTGLLRSSSSQGLSFDREHSDMDLAAVREFEGFPLYNVGESFEGTSLTKITQRLDTPRAPEYYRANFVNFIYGDCEPTGDTGCLPPFQIQTWPACIRNLSNYTYGPSFEPPPRERTTVRGVPAAVFRDPRVEIYTGRETVAIFAGTKEFGLQIAQALQQVNGGQAVTRDEPLPPPAAGALEGQITCTPNEYGPVVPLPIISTSSNAQPGSHH